MATIDEQIDALLASMEGRNPLELHALIHERRRKVAHAKAKAVQPAMGLHKSDAFGKVADELKDAWRKPLTDDDLDTSPGALDDLLLTVQDVMAADLINAEDAILALVRVARKAWACQIGTLGPIEGIKT